MDTKSIRFKTHIAGLSAPYPQGREFYHIEGDTAEVETGQADKWIASGVAVPVETAMRDPKPNAMRVLVRKRRR